MHFIKTFLIALAVWIPIVALLYWAYFTPSTEADNSPRFEQWVREFRIKCLEGTASRKCLRNDIHIHWKDSWRPPKLLWKNGIISPFVGVAPFFFLPAGKIRGTLLLDPEYFGELPTMYQKGVVWHELGHIILGLGHSDDYRSLMHASNNVDPVVGFGVMIEEWKENQ